MSVHMSSKPADEASRLPAAAWLVLGIVLVADSKVPPVDTVDGLRDAAPGSTRMRGHGPALDSWLGRMWMLCPAMAPTVTASILSGHAAPMTR